MLTSLVVCAHARSHIGDPKDRHVVIVDDLVQTGGTLIECSKVQYEPRAHCPNAHC